MPLPTEPVTTPEGALSWRAGPLEVDLSPHPAGWRLSRGGADLGLLARSDAAKLRVELGFSEGVVVARLDVPLRVEPGATEQIWLCWPMSWRLMLGDLLVAEARAGQRRALLGATSTGQVHPAVNVTLLDGPGPLPEGALALRVEITSREAEAVLVRRVPVYEPALALWQRDGAYAAGTVAVTLKPGRGAEAVTRADGAPPGFVVRHEARRTPMEALSWLLEATRAGVEFQP